MKGRDKFVVGWLVILYYCGWMFSLKRLFGIHFWDPKYALEDNTQHYVSTDLYNTTAFGEINETYFSSRRYHYFVPHIVGAIFWWNLYIFQLIPRIRHAFNKKIHRILGRCLMVCALLQTSSGVGLAFTSSSNIILIVSLWLAGSCFYCIYYAWRNAIARNIPKHKYWVLRLVGYLQTIAFQRFFMFILILTHQLGWYGLYPELTSDIELEEKNRIIRSMFDDSFVLAILTSFLGTEWYLAGEQGMTITEQQEQSTGTITTKYLQRKLDEKATTTNVDDDRHKNDCTTIPTSENKPLLA